MRNISETSLRSFVIRGVTSKAYKVWLMNPESGERTEIEALLHPVDGVIEYDLGNAFFNKSDVLIVLQAVL